MIVDLTDDDFESQVFHAKGLVLAYFWAPWCFPCRLIKPLLRELNESQPTLLIAKLNIDQHKAWLNVLEIRSIPAFLLFEDGQLLRKKVGPIPRGAFKRFIAGDG